MRNFALVFLLMLTTLLATTACGTKGPLYIPEERYPQEKPAQPAKTPAKTPVEVPQAR